MSWTAKMLRLSCSSGAARLPAQRGFTLIELMVTIAVLAILLGIAIPSFTDSTLGSKLRTQANDLVAGTVLARSEAIKRNQTVALCASSNGSSCTGTWSEGWIVLSTDGTVIMKHAAAATGFLVTSAQSSLTFQPTGIGSTATSLVVCRATPSVGSQERVVTISATGRASVTKTTNASCS